jgi:hypothetical protein
MAPFDHVKDPTGRSRDNVLAIVEFLDVFSKRGATNAGMALDIHVVTEGEDDRLNLSCQLSSRRENEDLGLSHGRVEALESRNRKRRRLSGSRLGLGNDVSPPHNRMNCPLLDGRGFLKVCR